VAVGKPGTETPRGRDFAIAERIPTGDPGHFLGPVVLPITGYSEVLNEFAGGNGRVAIHGTSLPELIGSAVSHGCIRMYNRDVVRLARLAQPGTPLTIRSWELSLGLPDPPLADARVALRDFRDEDLADVVAACRDPLVQRFTRIPADYGEAQGRAFIAGAAGRRARGESLELAVVGAAGGRLLGAVGLVMDRYDPARAEVGYWVAPWARGAGVAARALALLSRWALGPLGLARLDLVASVANPASMRVAERCGFVREGTLRKAWFRGPQREDLAVFSLLADDLAARRPG
jgi:RimJ/RimL family protein N-acetyltransferase